MSGSDNDIVRVENLCRQFKTLTAVSQASFSVRQGDILGIVGSDGAGKSTLLRMIATMIEPTSGKVYIDGLDVADSKEKVKDIIGYMPQRFGLYPDLTVAENIDFFMDIFGIFGSERQRRKEKYLSFSNLLPFTERLAQDLSGGMKQKLGLACVLVHQPRVLILDEPTNGVDPVSRREFWDILAQMQKQGMTILVSTAYLDEGEKCNRLILMHESRILDDATPAALRLNYPTLEEAMIQRILSL
ncbi:MAG TPA: ABC transporter ATP-binding protein [Desulfobacteraceae bacterium]|jgi:ABC-2 type transport system ATP-binding protein|nr:ABC transporter ATP-binding protein [Desulfobacteraceae bacterium]